MSDLLGKRLSEFLGKVDERVLKSKLNTALEMLKDGNIDELEKKIGKVDKKELLNKINDFDFSKLDNMDINKEDLQEKISDGDLQKLSQVIGENGDLVIEKIKGFLNK